MVLGCVDTLMLGRLGIHELDAAALGNIWLFGSVVFGSGVMMGIDPIISQAFGAGDRWHLGITLQRGIVVACMTSLPLILLLTITEPILRSLGQSGSLASAAQDYVNVQLFSIVPFLVYCALRGYLQGQRIVAPALWVMLIANVFNIVANWALIWGNLGCPALGLEGAGIASALSRGILCVGLIFWIGHFRLYRGAWVPWSRQAVNWSGLREIFRYGIPVGVQYSLELWAFQIATLLAGLSGIVELGAHTIVLNLVSLSFMLPLGLSMAVSTSVGNLLGARHYADAQRSAKIGMILGMTIMTFSALMFTTFRFDLPALYNSNPAVINLAAAILPIAAAFQFFDGVQAVGSGVLRAMGNTRPAALFNLIGYYLLALPLGAWLMFQQGWGLAGLWWGLWFGVAIVAACLVGWLRCYGPLSLRTLENNPSSEGRPPWFFPST